MTGNAPPTKLRARSRWSQAARGYPPLLRLRLTSRGGNREVTGSVRCARLGGGLDQFPDEVDHGDDVDREHEEGGRPEVADEFVDFKGDEGGVHDRGQVFGPTFFQQQPGPHRQRQRSVQERDGADPGEVVRPHQPGVHHELLQALILAADFQHVRPMGDDGRQIPVNQRERGDPQRDEEDTIEQFDDGDEDQADIVVAVMRRGFHRGR